MNELKKGLKKGDRFIDGGRIFEIDEVVPEGYISHMVDSQEIKQTRGRNTRINKSIEEEEKQAEKRVLNHQDDPDVLEKTDFEQHSKAELLQLAKELGVEVSINDKKNDIVEMLERKVRG